MLVWWEERGRGERVPTGLGQRFRVPVSCREAGRITGCPAHAIRQRATEITVTVFGASLRPRNSRTPELGTRRSNCEQGRLEPNGTTGGCAQPHSRVLVRRC